MELYSQVNIKKILSIENSRTENGITVSQYDQFNNCINLIYTHVDASGFN